MSSNGIRHFQQVVCAPIHVRSVFAPYPVMQSWWRVVLLLHGKPRDPLLSDAERVHCIADGFCFYALLYRMLAGVFLVLSAAFIGLHIIAAGNGSVYWITASLLAAIYLWLVSGLGYVGARAYSQRQPQSVSLLIAFIVMIIAFLSMFVAVVSVVAHQLGWVATGPNLLGALILFIFGVGSYLIEIIYLTTDGYLGT